MKFLKIRDTPNLQVYRIVSPTKQFKRAFPKKYIIGVNVFGNTHSLNENVLPNFISFSFTNGYVFTYDSTFPRLVSEPGTEIIDDATFPICLDKYFNKLYGKDDDKVDLILSCNSKNSVIVPICFTQEVIIRTNSEKLFGKKVDPEKVSEYILKIVNGSIVSKKTLENWVLEIISNVPTNIDGFPFRYPDTICEKDLIKKKIPKTSLFIGYDFRPRDREDIYEYENRVITAIEDAFENKKMKITIVDNFNGILKRVRDAHEKKKLPFKEEDDTLITTLENLRKLDIEYEINDFI